MMVTRQRRNLDLQTRMRKSRSRKQERSSSPKRVSERLRQKHLRNLNQSKNLRRQKDQRVKRKSSHKINKFSRQKLARSVPVLSLRLRSTQSSLPLLVKRRWLMMERSKLFRWRIKRRLNLNAQPRRPYHRKLQSHRNSNWALGILTLL